MRADDAGDCRRGFTAAKLQNMTFPPVRWVVDGFVSEGLTILAGKPKIGKSWLVIDIALTVPRGGVVLGGRACAKGTVLYAALEDNARRLQDRATRVLGEFEDWPENLTFWPFGEMSRLDAGGLDQVRDWIADHADAVLVIIDTFAKVRSGARGKETPYEADYREVGALKALADETGVAVLIVTHLRKAEADDPFDAVSGTLGITGAADTIILLKRDGQGVTLCAHGREVQEISAAVKFEDDLCRWRELGDAASVRRSDERSEVLAVLERAGEALTSAEVADETGSTNVATRKLLAAMTRAREIVRPERGRYALPPQSPGNSGNNGNNGSNGHKVTNGEDWR